MRSPFGRPVLRMTLSAATRMFVAALADGTNSSHLHAESWRPNERNLPARRPRHHTRHEGV